MRQISIVLALCGLMFSGSLALAKAKTNKEQPSKAVVNEFINIFYAHAVAFQPKNVGFARYASSMALDPKNPNWQEFTKAAQGVKVWPEIRQEGQGLVIGEGKNKVHIAVLDATGKISINGQPFNYDAKKPMLEQIQSMMMTKDTTAQNSWSHFLMNEAWADQENPGAAWAVTIPTVVGVAGSGALAFLSYAFGGVVAAGSAGPAALGVAAAGAICLAGQSWMHGTSFKQRYLNCAASPLSWFGMNPRDNLYLRKFENCSADKISAIVTSPNGSEQKREFIFSNGKLVTVRMTNLKTSETATLSANQSGNALLSGQVSSKEMKDRALSSDQVIEAQSLLRDAHYYRGVCNDPERRDLIESGIAEGDRAYDTSTPGQMLNNAPAAK